MDDSGRRDSGFHDSGRHDRGFLNRGLHESFVITGSDSVPHDRGSS